MASRKYTKNQMGRRVVSKLPTRNEDSRAINPSKIGSDEYSDYSYLSEGMCWPIGHPDYYLNMYLYLHN